MLNPSQPTTYDAIGRGYRSNRVPDARIAKAIRDALGDARTVCNVGAGTGSYEPADLDVIAVEPSVRMIQQRINQFPVIQAVAEHLPFKDKAFDACLAVLTIHHWVDPAGGLTELKRVSRKQVIFTFDPDYIESFWLVRDYFPAIIEFDRERSVPTSTLTEILDVRSIESVPVPWNCTDGFQAAYWRRPECYLDPAVRNSISTFAQLPPGFVDRGIQSLAADLESGEWKRKYADLLTVDEMDFGYRLVVAGEVDGGPVEQPLAPR